MIELRRLDAARLWTFVLAASVIGGCTLLAVADLAALPVGVVFLGLIVAGHLAAVYRYADVVAALAGMVAYAILERGQGHTGGAAFFVALCSFVAVVAAARYLEASLRRVEAHETGLQLLADELTTHDDASGLLKRRFGELAIEEEILRSRRTSLPVTLVLAAPDPVPDHPVELPPDFEIEAALVGSVFRGQLRTTDRTTRLATETFAAILPGTDAMGGAIVAEKLRQIYMERGGRELRFGIATFPDNALAATDLLEEANAALHMARTGGMDLASPAMLAN